MNNEKLIKCIKIGVDCVGNDPVDIRCGGPLYLGFDFNVLEKEQDEMKEYIAQTLVKFDVPVTRIYASELVEITEKDIWTKERIAKEIEKEALYLQSEAERNNYSTYRIR